MPDADRSEALPVYKAIAADVEALGTTDVFGLIGDDTAKLGAELAGRGLFYHGARHENAAVAMAVGYAEATGRLGVCVLSRGPGMTNGLTAIINAGKGGARLLILTGADPLAAPGAPAGAGPDGKSYDSDGYGGPWYRQFTPGSVAEVQPALRQALACAMAGLPAALAVPKNFFDAPLADLLPSPGAPAARPPQPLREEAIGTAVTLLERSARPLIIAGKGAWEAGAKVPLERLAERTGALLATTLKAKDMWRGSPYDLGLIGTFSHSAARLYMEGADCVLALGASLNQFTTSKGEALPRAPLIQVDSTRVNIGRWHPADVGVVGDAALVAEALLERLGERAERPFHDPEVLNRLAAFDPREDFEPEDTRWTIDPRSLVLLFDELLPADRGVVTDTGNFFGHVPPHIRVADPSRFKCSSDFSSIGLGPGTALGFATGRRESLTALFVGDGTMLMTLGEIETLARLELPAVFVVMNDSAYGAERHYLELQGVSGSKCVFPETDFAGVAESLGVEGATVRSAEDLRALAPRLAEPAGPLVIDCKVTPSVAAPFIAEGLGSAAVRAG
jgi:thiamine pyrophosphate-dependent acetolactate synthase large subunit-like protein